MKSHRIFLSGFLAVSCIFLSAFIKAEESHDPVLTKQRPDFEKTHDNTKLFKSSHKKAPEKRKLVNAKSANATDEISFAKQRELQKPLDLSIPFTDADKSDRLTELNTDTSIQKTNIFANENKKKTRPVQVDGRLLMSSEPESEKQKSADGAGIVINLKP